MMCGVHGWCAIIRHGTIFRHGAVLVMLAFAAPGLPAQRQLIVLDPGHSHAADVFENDLPGVSNEVHVYAPPGPEVNAFLKSASSFNHRSRKPAHWKIEPYIAADFLPRMLLEPPGNIVVISGRNNAKINNISSSLRRGQNVLADKPWIIDSQDFSQLEAALSLAEQRHLVAFDCMTERFNVAYRIQRELVRDPDVFGRPLTGTAADPAVVLQNVHSLVKFDGGRVNLRPSWFLDTRQQGAAIADVGTHLIDLEMWTLFPNQALDYRRDIKVLKATHAPIFLTRPQFERVTGAQAWPAFLRESISHDRLEYDCDNSALFTMRGIYTAISDRWEYESVGALNDTYLVLYRGTRATIRVRQSRLENYLPEVVVIPNPGQSGAALKAALEKRVKNLSNEFPNLGLQSDKDEIRVLIPQADRERGGSTFDQLVRQFLGYVHDPGTLPSWEKPNMLAKYYVTTKALELARVSR